MSKKRFLVFFFLLVTAQCFSQKTFEKVFEASGINSLIINSDSIFTVYITSKKTNKITVKTKVAGETYENVVLNTAEENGKLIITIGYSPFFKTENDKLAAHKVIAIDMEIVIPERLQIEIISKIASVITKGTFNKIITRLENGNCELIDFYGNALLQSKVGSIKVSAKTNVAGIAVSTKGTIINNLKKKGKYLIEAESIEGSITLLQIK